MHGAKGEWYYLSIALAFASILLVVGAVFLIQILSTIYGTGAGAIVQSSADKANVTSILQPVTTQLSAVYHGIVEAYVELLIALLIFSASLGIYANRNAAYSSAGRRYLLLNLTLAFIYAIFFVLTLHSSPIPVTSNYLYIPYFGIVATIAIDVYLELEIHTGKARSVGRRLSIAIRPESPYRNIVELRESLFSNISGNICILDKHFNSKGIDNLYRLLEGSTGGISKITVITSAEMLDSQFGANYRDLQEELRNRNIEFEVKVMGDADAMEQHERFIFDDSMAFKIPPLNIINKKSEHITRINRADAAKRFNALEQRSVKFENYIVKKG